MDDAVLTMMSDRLTRLEEKLDRIGERIVDTDRMTHLETRVTDLEKWKAMVLGGAAVAGAVCGVVAGFLGHLLALRVGG